MNSEVRPLGLSSRPWLWTAAALAISGAILLGAPAKAEPAHCTAASAVPVAIQTVQSERPQRDGRCVRVVGIASGGRLYASRSALREPLDAYGDAKQSIVILAPEPHKWRGRRVEVVGTIGDCRRANDVVRAMAEADSSQIVMVGGYCHTSLATTIRPDEVLPTRRR